MAQRLDPVLPCHGVLSPAFAVTSPFAEDAGSLRFVREFANLSGIVREKQANHLEAYGFFDAGMEIREVFVRLRRRALLTQRIRPLHDHLRFISVYLTAETAWGDRTTRPTRHPAAGANGRPAVRPERRPGYSRTAHRATGSRP